MASILDRWNRKLTVGSLEGAPTGDCVQSPFVTLLPAYNVPERQQAQALTRKLIALGCIEFCCVGPEAELLHDALDEIIEADGTLEVVTTWVDDLSEATEYFLHGAAGARVNLLALVSEHPRLRAMLEDEVKHSAPK